MIEKFGDWDIVGLMTANMASEIKEANKESLKKVGLEAEAKAVKHLRDQDLPWQPLNKEYKKRKMGVKGRKRKDGGNDRRFKRKSGKILIATSSYFQSITSWATDKFAYAGVKKTAKDKDGKVIADIARVHEYGSVTRNIPARPLWRPVKKETLEWLKRKNLFEKTLMNRLKNKYKVGG